MLAAAAHFPNGIIFKFNPSIMPILFLIVVLQLFLSLSYPLAISFASFLVAVALAMKLPGCGYMFCLCELTYKKIINRMNFFFQLEFLMRVLRFVNGKVFHFLNKTKIYKRKKLKLYNNRKKEASF